jgi:hypothetical protein
MTDSLNPWWQRWPVLAAVLGAAALLRLYALGYEGLWCDEAYTAWTIRLPWLDMLTRLARHDDAPPLFYVLQRSLRWLGDGEGVLRLLPASAGIAAVALLLTRARNRLDARAFWTAAVLAVSALPLFYARQVRSYGLILLLALLVVMAGRDLLLEGGRRNGIVLAVAGILLCLTHNLGVLLVLASLPLWLLHRRGAVSMASWIGWHCLPLAACGIWWLAAGSQLEQHAELNVWMGASWENRSLALAPGYTLQVFIPGLLHGATARQSIPVLIHTGILLPLLSGAVALLALPALFSRRSPEWRGTVYEGAMFLLPLLALIAATAVWAPVYVVGRTDFIVYPAFALLLGRALSRWRWFLGLGAVFLWCGLSVATLLPSYGLAHTDQAKGEDRRVASYLASRPGFERDWLVHGIATAPSVEYYLRNVEHNRVWFPEVSGMNPAAVPDIPEGMQETFLRKAADLRSHLEAALPEDGSVWIIGILVRNAEAGEPATVTFREISYPTNVLVHTLVGSRSLVPERVYRQDWMAGRRVLLRLPKREWVPVVDSVPSSGG